jgi:hypothetical protein
MHLHTRQQVPTRKTERYLISGTVRFQWLAANGEWEDAVGISSDIGKAGVFVESESMPSVDLGRKLIAVQPNGWWKARIA